jgi:alpha-beta hydrolase superfamily lysophospholipase
MLPDGYETDVFAHHPPEGAPAGKRPVLYLHGIQSHPGWFYGSCVALAEAGRAVFQVTRRGSGACVVGRGHAENANQLLDDLDAACGFVLTQADCETLHLLGVSWGGKLATVLALRECEKNRRFASLTLVAPGIVPQVDVSARTKLALAVSLLTRRGRKRFPIPLNDVSLFTDTKAMRRYLSGDEFRLHEATASLLYASRRLDHMVRRAPRSALTLPITLLLASHDRIIDNIATREILERIAGENLETVELLGSHTLEFEPDPQPLHDALVRAVARGEE